MNFLELVKRTFTESGLSGVGPASVTNQTGMNAKLVNWVRDAWIDIQAAHQSWKFLRKKEVRTLAVSKRVYAMVGDLNLPSVRKWDERVLFIRDTATGERAPLRYLDYDDFELAYATFQPGRPSTFTVDPDYNICFNATPDKAYAVDFHFWMTGEKLVEPEDVPSIPEDYHMVIVWKALTRYTSHDGAEKMKVDVHEEFASSMRALERNQLDIPNHVQVVPLA
jgi:hypothetical protein